MVSHKTAGNVSVIEQTGQSHEACKAMQLLLQLTAGGKVNDKQPNIDGQCGFRPDAVPG